MKVKVIAVGVSALILAISLAACSAGEITPTPTATYGEASKLVFTAQPTTAMAMSPFSVSPVVTVQDSNGNTVTNPAVVVTLTITPQSGANNATLFGGTTVRSVNGVVTFKDLSIGVAGSGYTLTASSRGLTSAISNPFDITPGLAAKVAFTTEPIGNNAGLPFVTQPVVVVQDAYGNKISDSSAAVTLFVIYGASTGAVLNGNTVVNAVNGMATFNNLSINLANSYTLTAVSSGLTPGISARFTISPSTAAKLVFYTQPGEATAGSAFESQPELHILDKYGNETNYTGPVTVSITPGTGTVGAVLSGTTTKTAENGVVWFEDQSINLSGSGYMLTATSGNLTPATSDAFDVKAPK